MRAQGPAEHCPGAPPAQRRSAEPEAHGGKRSDRELIQEQDAPAGGGGELVSGYALTAAASGGSDGSTNLDSQGSDAERRSAGSAVEFVELEGVLVQSLVRPTGFPFVPRSQTLFG